MTFSELGLCEDLKKTLGRLGYSEPTPIQEQAIPLGLTGRDLLATAETGTGKTAAFTLPLLQRLAEAPGTGSGRRKPRALILTPTRELAGQVNASVTGYGKGLGLRSAEVVGGTNINHQIRALRGGLDIVVATPGRLIDHLQRGTVDLGQVTTLVLDEADRMLDMGFLPSIERILKTLPAGRHTMLFSATFSAPIRRLAGEFLNNPQTLELAERNAAASNVQQAALWVDRARKRELLTQLFGEQDWHQVLIFTRTKRGADRLSKQLSTDGIDSAAIHGDKSQAARTRALSSFKRNKTQALVATDVAARGIDIDQLPCVVNYDLPDNPEDYVHRIGRTGRAGESGEALSLVSPAERAQFGAIKRLLDTEIPGEVRTGFELTERGETKGKPNNGNKGKPNKRPPRQGRKRPSNNRQPAAGNQ